MPYLHPDHHQIGRIAALQMRSAGAGSSQDDADLGAYYSEQAYADMHRTGYDPTFYHDRAEVIDLARAAAIEYVKASLGGMLPAMSGAYLSALRAWQKRAAVDKHVYGVQPDD